MERGNLPFDGWNASTKRWFGGAFFDAFPALSALVSLGLRDIWTPLDALIRGYATFCNGWLVLALNQYATPVFAYGLSRALFSDCITIF